MTAIRIIICFAVFLAQCAVAKGSLILSISTVLSGDSEALCSRYPCGQLSIMGGIFNRVVVANQRITPDDAREFLQSARVVAYASPVRTREAAYGLLLGAAVLERLQLIDMRVDGLKIRNDRESRAGILGELREIRSIMAKIPISMERSWLERKVRGLEVLMAFCEAWEAR